MAKRSDITPELCRQLLRYDAETGKLYWLKRTPEIFFERFNTRYGDREAMTAVNHAGHLVGSIVGVSFMAHHVVWALCTGTWPVHQIDHLNGVPSDNRFENLRDVPQSENTKNLALRSNNTSGVPGVGWSQSHGKWRARISDGHLGYFDSREEAIAARHKHATAAGYILRVGHD